VIKNKKGERRMKSNINTIKTGMMVLALSLGGTSAFADGESLYNKTCSMCHQKTGLGMVPVFPALKGSPMVTGPLAAHILQVLNGKGGMPAWKSMSDDDLAAIITYERNAWGNDTGDTVTAGDIKALR
jgi:cytochrome c oxidase subunit 2